MTGFWFWICVGMQLWKGSEYSRIPNMLSFRICNCSDYGSVPNMHGQSFTGLRISEGYTGCWICLNNPDYVLTMSQCAWICLNDAEYAWICLHIPEYRVCSIKRRASNKRYSFVINQYPEKQHTFSQRKTPNKKQNEASRKPQIRNKEKIIVFGDSIPKGIKLDEFNQNLRNSVAKFQFFPGATSRKLLHYVDPTLEEENFKSAVIHVGTNDLMNNYDSKTGDALIENIKNIALKCISYGVCKIFISSICFNNRTNNEYRMAINNKISQLCRENNFKFINNNSITEKHLYRDDLHLLYSGKIILANNIINTINDFLSMHLYFPNSF